MTTEQRREYFRRFRQNNRERVLERQRRWVKSNPEKVKAAHDRFRATEKGQAGIEKSNKRAVNRRRMKTILTKCAAVVSVIRHRKSNLLERQVAWHISRGRDAATTVVFMELPASVIVPIYERLKTATPSTTY